MSDILTLGSTAVSVYQQALNGVANNIANVNTEGYTRQEAGIISNAPRQVGTLYLGTGARFDGMRRQYDAFIEASLRTSISDVNTPNPVVQYAERLIDIMGDRTTGLATAMDRFFGSAQTLSNEAASMVHRATFISEAQGLADRFRSLRGQLSTVEIETRDAIQADVRKINAIAAELATVNAQLGKRISVKDQPLELLDQRDRLLRDLSALVRVTVFESTNGSVDVSLGSSRNEGLLVSGRESSLLAASFQDSAPDKVDLVLNPYTTPRSVSTVSSGTLGGLMAMREQVLGPAMNDLDFLAEVMVKEINAVHQRGVDARGDAGEAIFTIDPSYRLANPATQTSMQVSIEVVEPQATRFHDIELQYLEREGLWLAIDKVTGQSARGFDEININGVRMSLAGNPRPGEILLLAVDRQAAAGIRLLVNDPMKVAAAAPFRVIEDAGNLSGSDASVRYESGGFSYPLALDRVLSNNPYIQAGSDIQNPIDRPAMLVGAVPAGFSDLSLLFEPASFAEGMDLQILTRDGRHLLGRPLSDTQRASLFVDQQAPGSIVTAGGFMPGATYSADYLNRSGDDGYLGLDVFLGARAAVQTEPVRDEQGNITGTVSVGSRLASGAIPQQTFTATTQVVDGQTVVVPAQVIGANRIAINGVSLGALTLTPTLPSLQATLQASDVAQWLNSAGSTAVPPVVATARTEIRVDPGRIDPTRGLMLNGESIGASFGTVPGLITAINAKTATTGISAYVGQDGALVLAHASGGDIVVGDPPFPNALGLNTGRYGGTVTLESAAEIRLELTGGSPADLSRLGFATQAQVEGLLPEDLLVFVTGAGAAKLAAGYETGALDPVQSLRGRPLDVVFTSKERFEILDVQTSTVVASRAYTPGSTIRYGGLVLSFVGPPAAGDRFRIDGNQDGLGDNANILAMVALEKARDVVAGNRTFAEAYRDRVNAVGNAASQARVSRAALEVVAQQAVQAREAVSGVNLDREAADLIRFQQAYQASARVIQVAGQLFDAIIQLR